MLLEFIVSECGIEANLKKITTITRMGLIGNVKGVQWIMGCLAALSRFISRLSERGPPLYRLLKKTNQFTWTAEAQEALDKVKELMMKAPILVLPAEKEPFLLYVAATAQVVNVALVIEREEAGHALRVQCPIYFVSKVLADSKIPYPQIQKLVYTALVT
jgi:hypothetical protein